MRFIRTLIVLLIAALLAANCVTLAPPEQRKKEIIREASGSKQKLWEKAFVFLAKTYNDSNEALKYKDKEAGRIVGQISLSCNAVSQANVAFGNPPSIKANLDFTSKDNKYRLIFDDIQYGVTSAQSGVWSLWGPSSAADTEKYFNACLVPFSDRLHDHLTGGSNDDF